MAYGAIAQIFLAGARGSFGRITAGMAFRIAPLNEAELFRKDGQITMSFTNYQTLMNTLKVVGPDLKKNFQKGAVKYAAPLRNQLKSTLKGIGPEGPLPGPLRPGRRFDRWISQNGRLSWGMTGGSQHKHRPYDEVRSDFKDRSSEREKRKLERLESGRLGFVRLRVTSGPTVIADIAGISGKYMRGDNRMSKFYDINLFGRGIINRQHRISSENSRNFVDALKSRGRGRLPSKPNRSRYAYPSVRKGRGKFEYQMKLLISSTVTELNARINRNV